MNEEIRDVLNGFWTLLAFIALVLGCVRGCSIMNNPETIRADNETRMKWAEFDVVHPGRK